ncbi:unnamed protein product [Amoebophrya sp. A25]|nr:unnamed protein product [Amoebophrya sp. A25]|eukprot:GSA25T00002843001.1
MSSSSGGRPLVAHALQKYLPAERAKDAQLALAGSSSSGRAGQSGSTTRQLAQRVAGQVSLFVPGEKALPDRNSETLAEDDFLAGLGAIVERDFFPDLPKLRLQLELVQAETAEEKTEIARKILDLERRQAEKEVYNPADLTAIVQRPDDGKYTTVNTKSLSLDEYVAKYTSEDNASFRKIVEKDFAKKRQKEAYVEKKSEFDRLHLSLTNAEKLAEEYSAPGEAAANLKALRDAYEEDHRRIASGERRWNPQVWKKNLNKNVVAAGGGGGASSKDGGSSTILTEKNSKLKKAIANLQFADQSKDVIETAEEEYDPISDPNNYEIKREIDQFLNESGGKAVGNSSKNAGIGVSRFFLNPAGQNVTKEEGKNGGGEVGGGLLTLENGGKGLAANSRSGALAITNTAALSSAGGLGGSSSSSSSSGASLNSASLALLDKRDRTNEMNATNNILRDDRPIKPVPILPADAPGGLNVPQGPATSSVAGSSSSINKKSSNTSRTTSSSIVVSSGGASAGKSGQLAVVKKNTAQPEFELSRRNVETLGLRTQVQHEARSALYFAPRGIIPASHLRRQGETNFQATRFPVRQNFKKEAKIQEEKRKQLNAEAQKEVDYMDMADRGEFKNMGSGSSFVETPHMTPDHMRDVMGMSPLMTYGAVASTPLLVDGVPGAVGEDDEEDEGDDGGGKMNDAGSDGGSGSDEDHDTVDVRGGKRAARSQGENDDKKRGRDHGDWSSEDGSEDEQDQNSVKRSKKSRSRGRGSEDDDSEDDASSSPSNRRRGGFDLGNRMDALLQREQKQREEREDAELARVAAEASVAHNPANDVHGNRNLPPSSTVYSLPSQSREDKQRVQMQQNRKQTKEELRQRQMDRMRELGVNIDEFGHRDSQIGGRTPSSRGALGGRTPSVAGGVAASSRSSRGALGGGTGSSRGGQQRSRGAPSVAGSAVSEFSTGKIQLSDRAIRALNSGQVAGLPAHLTPGYSSIFDKRTRRGAPGTSASSSRVVAGGGATPSVEAGTSSRNASRRAPTATENTGGSRTVGKFARNLGCGTPSLNVHPSLRTPNMNLRDKDIPAAPALKKPKR